MLEALERGNLFVVPLDDRRRWYRYHHLFADVLRAHLLDEQPDHVPELHRRASAWYEQNGERSEAIRHALAAEDFERAADLVELAVPATAQEPAGGHAAWAGSRRSPTSCSAAGPCSASAYAGALLASRRARGRRGPPAGRRAVAGRDGDRARADRDARRPGWSSWTKRSSAGSRAAIAVHRAGLALVLGDVADTVTHARRALDLARRGRPSRARSGRGAPGARVLDERGPRGSAPGVRRRHGEPAAGRAHLRRRSAAPSPWPTSGSRRAVSARRCAPTSRRCSSRPEQGGPVLRGTADMHVGLSELHRERNDLRCRHAAPADAARSWASTPGCRRTGTAGASRWRGSGRPRAIWTARSTCSTRRSACTWATSPPTCARSRR